MTVCVEITPVGESTMLESADQTWMAKPTSSSHTYSANQQIWSEVLPVVSILGSGNKKHMTRTHWFPGIFSVLGAKKNKEMSKSNKYLHTLVFIFIMKYIEFSYMILRQKGPVFVYI